MQPRPVRNPHEFISHTSHSSPNVSGGHTQWPVSGSHTWPGLSQGSHSVEENEVSDSSHRGFRAPLSEKSKWKWGSHLCIPLARSPRSQEGRHRRPGRRYRACRGTGPWSRCKRRCASPGGRTGREHSPPPSPGPRSRAAGRSKQLLSGRQCCGWLEIQSPKSCHCLEEKK